MGTTEEGVGKFKKEELQQLLDNFFELCSICDELDIYEIPGLEDDMIQMREWVVKNFGRKL